ncbi:MAG: ATP-binding protein [Ekhidna sp.]
MVRAIQCSFLLMLISFNVFSQNLTEEQSAQIEQYKLALGTAVENNELVNAASVSSKIAYTFWDGEEYDEAISFFNKSIEYCNKVKNVNGVKTVRFNLGLVNIDKGDYQAALDEFNKGVVIARDLNQKKDILTGLINIASISQSLGQNQEAVDNALEALEYAQELKNLSLTKRCYGILYESYQELGNSEKSIEYFDLYSTVDKFMRDEQVKQIEEESEQKVSSIQNEKDKTDKKLYSSNQQLQVAKDSLQIAREITERQKLQLKLNEVTLREKEAQLKNEKLIRYGLTGIVLLTIIFLIVLYVQYRQKKKKNILLQTQYEKINSQKEKIEKQGEYLSIKNEELVVVNKEKNLMMSMVAHDLKKPINDLSSLSSLLEVYKDNLPDDFNNLIGIIGKSADGYKKMVHKILDAGAIENRKLNVVQEKLNLVDVLTSNAEVQSILASKKKITFNVEDIPESAYVKGDSIYLSQAMENIAYNSIKYSPEESTIFIGAKKSDGNYNIYIRDEGPGIDKKDQIHLFDMFKPLKSGDSESSGLGLSIAKKYMEAMEGTIHCESDGSNGTTFFLGLKEWS